MIGKKNYLSLLETYLKIRREGYLTSSQILWYSNKKKKFEKQRPWWEPCWWERKVVCLSFIEYFFLLLTNLVFFFQFTLKKVGKEDQGSVFLCTDSIVFSKSNTKKRISLSIKSSSSPAPASQTKIIETISLLQNTTIQIHKSQSNLPQGKQKKNKKTEKKTKTKKRKIVSFIFSFF